MNIFQNENKYTLGFILLISTYIFYLIFFNISKGFDLTDESYYILNYSNYNELLLSSLALFRYPITLLNYLVADNLLLLRFISILILMFSSIWLGYEFQKYIQEKFDFNLNKIEIINIILVVFLGTLAYYKAWLFTPSYNWLALLICILFYAIFFNIINNQSKNIFKYLLLGLILTISFLAKPTTTIILISVGCIILFSEYKKIHYKSLFFTVFVSGVFFLFSFLLFTYGSINNYLEYVIENFRVLHLMESGHSLNDMFENYIKTLSKFFFEKFLINTSPVYYKYFIITSAGLFILVSLKLKEKTKVVKYFQILLNSHIIIYGILLISNFYQLKMNSHLLGLYLCEFILFLFFFMGIYFIFIDKMEIKSFLKKFLLPLVLFFLGIVAYVFGTNTNIVYKITDSTIFFYMIILIMGLFLNKKLNIKYIQNIINVVLVLSILILLIKGYEYPYRQEAISNQKYPITFTDKNYTLYVDEENKEYIETLKKLSLEYNFKESNYLLDMTGGTPGVNAILNAKFFTLAWLSGGYPGSNNFAYEILKKHIDSENLKNAWILIAKDGKRALDLNILNNLNLNFPNNYEKIGTLFLSDRKETQEVWIPKIKEVKE